MNFVYIRFICKSHLAQLISGMILVAVMQILVVTLIATLDAGPILETLLEQFPEGFRRFINEQMLAGLTLKGAAAFGFNHPLVLMILGGVAIGLPNRHLSREFESGTMELLLAHPIKRHVLLLSLWISGACLLLVIVGGGLAASLSAIAGSNALTTDLTVSLSQIALNVWLLFIAVMSYTMVLEVHGTQGSRVSLWSAGLTLVLFLLDIVTRLTDHFVFIRPLNIFTYFQPQDLILQQGSFGLNAGVLCALIAGSLIWAVVQFNRRDIPG